LESQIFEKSLVSNKKIKRSKQDSQNSLKYPLIYRALVLILIGKLFRDGPFNIQGGGGGLWVFFMKKKILVPNVAERNILILVEEKKII
jgi:hypothetical protein